MSIEVDGVRFSLPLEALSPTQPRLTQGMSEELPTQPLTDVLRQQPEMVELGDSSVVNQAVKADDLSSDLRYPYVVVCDVGGIEAEDLRKAIHELFVVSPITLGSDSDGREHSGFGRCRRTDLCLVVHRARGRQELVDGVSVGGLSTRQKPAEWTPMAVNPATRKVNPAIHEMCQNPATRPTNALA